MSGLEQEQIDVLAAIAEVLLSSTKGRLVPSELDDFEDWLRRAAKARSRTPESVVTALESIEPGDVEGSLRRLEATSSDGFELIAAIAVGAYTMHPAVMAALGYPQAHRAPIPVDQSVEELSTGILDGVLTNDRARLREVPD